MPLKKVVALPSTRAHRTELEYLYARLLAIDALIVSLEEYHRCRTKRLDPRKRRTA